MGNKDSNSQYIPGNRSTNVCLNRPGFTGDSVA